MKITICQPFLNHPGIRVTHGILFLGANKREAKQKKKRKTNKICSGHTQSSLSLIVIHWQLEPRRKALEFIEGNSWRCVHINQG